MRAQVPYLARLARQVSGQAMLRPPRQLFASDIYLQGRHEPALRPHGDRARRNGQPPASPGLGEGMPAAPGTAPPQAGDTGTSPAATAPGVRQLPGEPRGYHTALPDGRAFLPAADAAADAAPAGHEAPGRPQVPPGAPTVPPIGPAGAAAPRPDRPGAPAARAAVPLEPGPATWPAVLSGPATGPAVPPGPAARSAVSISSGPAIRPVVLLEPSPATGPGGPRPAGPVPAASPPWPPDGLRPPGGAVRPARAAPLREAPAADGRAGIPVPPAAREAGVTGRSTEPAARDLLPPVPESRPDAAPQPRVSIGAIEVTVVPPSPAAATPATQPGAQAPAGRPPSLLTSAGAGRLRDGLRRWYGTAQG
jgi:hypothetical protein